MKHDKFLLFSGPHLSCEIHLVRRHGSELTLLLFLPPRNDAMGVKRAPSTHAADPFLPPASLRDKSSSSSSFHRRFLPFLLLLHRSLYLCLSEEAQAKGPVGGGTKRIFPQSEALLTPKGELFTYLLQRKKPPF